MEPVDRTNEDFRDLISDLDTKLGRVATSTTATAPETKTAVHESKHGKLHKIPSWLMLVLVTVVGLGLGAAAVQPWQERCTYDADLCRVERLDIDALRVTIPNSELFDRLPNIDAIDPNDELTAGDIFDMEQFEDLDLEALLTREEIDLLLMFID